MQNRFGEGSTLIHICSICTVSEKCPKLRRIVEKAQQIMGDALENDDMDVDLYVLVKDCPLARINGIEIEEE